MKHRDKIEIKGLRVMSRVGVPDEERENAQELSLDLIIYPASSLQGLSDDIENTIDYYQVAMQVQRVAESGQRRLIETLAEEVAQTALGFDGVEVVDVKIKKYILPNTEFVSVSIRRGQD